MEYEITTVAPITEQEALESVAAMGFHGLAFDDIQDQDETLHWHEFDAVTWVISGTGRIADEHGKVTELQPGCRLQAPAGFLHRTLAGTNVRLVIGTNLPGEVWTSPLNKEPERAEKSSGLLIGFAASRFVSRDVSSGALKLAEPDVRCDL